MMRILSVGTNLYLSTVESAQFRSTTSFLDFDLVIIDPESVFQEYVVSSYLGSHMSSQYRGYPSLDAHTSVRLTEDLARRTLEMRDMLRLGRSIVAFLPAPSKVYVETGQNEVKGSGRSAITTTYVTEVLNLSILPIPISAVAASGSQIELRGGKPYKDFWEKIGEYSRYRAYITKGEVTPFLFVRGTERVVGAVAKQGSGFVFLLPKIELPLSISVQKRTSIIQRVLGAIQDFLAEANTSGELAQPDWALRFQLPEEVKARETVRKLEKEVEKLSNRLARERVALAEIEKSKVIFTGAGRGLELQVKLIFESLGFEVTEGEPGRDDLILKWDETIAVVEVKGVSKSAAEKHAAQLEKWVSEYFAGHSIHPKGILLVNAYREAPLDERSEPAFPAQMLPYCERREHCLLTTTQLLCLYLDCRDDASRREEMIKELLTTNGIFPHYHNWNDYLHQEK